MAHDTRIFSIALLLAAFATSAAAQTQNAQSSVVVPRMVNFSGRAVDPGGRIASGIAGATFAIYSRQSGGTPLWIETQNVIADTRGNYTAQLGATRSSGLPVDLFTSGQARWLGVRINGGEEQPRVLLLSVPYALKAADAETVGGLPASAFVLAAPSLAGITPPTPSATPTSTLTGTGTTGSIALWDSSSDLTSSAIVQTGSGSTARIGINTNPSATLDVKGTSNFRGTTTMPSAGLATASAGKSSYPFVFATSAFSTSAKASVLQNFRWQAEPVNNNSSSASGSLNLLFSSGTGTPGETGLSIAGNGQITFAPGQTFPGGSGTITGVTAGKGLTGGGASGNVTLSLDLTQAPLLAASNTFTGNQTVNGNLSATGAVTGSSFQIGSNLFGLGSFNLGNAFLGFAGNTLTTGYSNTGLGKNALIANATGIENTAIGIGALAANTTGETNTAVGLDALGSNRTGSQLTCIGNYCDVSADGLFAATAIGAGAQIGASGTLILGGINIWAVSVGIGTSKPYKDYGLTVDATNSSPVTGGIVVNSTTGNMHLGMVKGVHKFRVDINGITYSDGGFQSSGADFAESVAVRGPRSGYEPGDVLEIDEASDRHLALAQHAYSHLVAGIYSTKPGMLASPHHIDDPAINTSEVPLAVIGIVPCKVTAANGPIARGDLLVASSRRGYAMKGTDHRRMLGAVVGKALEPMVRGSGVIQVLVTLQ